MGGWYLDKGRGSKREKETAGRREAEKTRAGKIIKGGGKMDKKVREKERNKKKEEGRKTKKNKKEKEGKEGEGEEEGKRRRRRRRRRRR